MTFAHGPIAVRTPASAANLGPGFDSLGLALTMHDRLDAEVLDDGVRGRISPNKLPAARWVEIIEACHRVGLRSTSTVKSTWPGVSMMLIGMPSGADGPL